MPHLYTISSAQAVPDSQAVRSQAVRSQATRSQATRSQAMRRHASRATACGSALLLMAATATAAAQTAPTAQTAQAAQTAQPAQTAQATTGDEQTAIVTQTNSARIDTARIDTARIDTATAAHSAALTEALNHALHAAPIAAPIAAQPEAETAAEPARQLQTRATMTPRSAQGQAPHPEPPSRPITDRERADWAIRSTVGLRSLGVGVLSAGWNTAWNRPEEYHGTWEGFGKRYAVRLSGVAIGNGMEAGLGTLWGEDPRYTPAGGGNAWQRIGHATRMTVMAYNREGQLMPAYARYAGTVGNNFITNAWRPDSENSAGGAMARSAIGITGRLASNLFEEFWPDLRRRLSRDRP